jgi:hypothetical protein
MAVKYVNAPLEALLTEALTKSGVPSSTPLEVAQAVGGSVAQLGAQRWPGGR